jgi:hypothetical protein
MSVVRRLPSSRVVVLLAAGAPVGMRTQICHRPMLTARDRRSERPAQPPLVRRAARPSLTQRINVDAATYSDLLDMLELAWARQGEDFMKVNPWLRDEEALGWIWDRLGM